MLLEVYYNQLPSRLLSNMKMVEMNSGKLWGRMPPTQRFDDKILEAFGLTELP